MIDGRNFLGAYDGVALGDEADAGAEFDLARHRARDAESYKRIDDVRIGLGNLPIATTRIWSLMGDGNDRMLG